MRNQQESYNPEETGVMARKNTVRVPYVLIISVLGVSLSGAGAFINNITHELRELNTRMARLEAQQEMLMRKLP